MVLPVSDESQVKVDTKYCVVIVGDPSSEYGDSNYIDVILHSSWTWCVYVGTGILAEDIKQVFIEYGAPPSGTLNERAVDMLLLTYDEDILRQADGFQYVHIMPEDQGEIADQYANADADARPGLGVEIARGWLDRNGISPHDVQYTTGIVGD